MSGHLWSVKSTCIDVRRPAVALYRTLFIRLIFITLLPVNFHQLDTVFFVLYPHVKRELSQYNV
jgi:hypothetical protein